jgi:hypothetical protein
LGGLCRYFSPRFCAGEIFSSFPKSKKRQLGCRTPVILFLKILFTEEERPVKKKVEDCRA